MPRREEPKSESWYLDPVVARQKQAAHLELISGWVSERPGLLLKTDLFEEANGDDQLLFELCSRCDTAIGFDINLSTVERARLKCPPGRPICFLAADVRSIPLLTGCIDLIVSSSTLDHFETAEDFGGALGELVRVLRPGGMLILSLDNPLNPMYWPLRWFSFAGPFRLGYTPFPRALRRQLEQAKMEVIGSAGLLHNPRAISTLLFLGLRRLLGDGASPFIRGLLSCFAGWGRIPTRRFTCCFYAVVARKRPAS